MESSYYRTIKDMEEYVSVVDVYDSAALIGKDFEYLIEQYGVEAVTDLMPKVIKVLEQLEFLAAKSEKENDELLELVSTIKRLQSEKEERAKEKARYEQELEQIEESYRSETKDLCQMVSNLQEQNRKLKSRLHENTSGQEAADEKTQEDLQVIQTLKETVTKQRGQIKGLQTEIKQKDNEVDSMQNQLAKLVRTNQHLQITSSSFKSETNQLLAEHRHLQNTLQEKDRQIISIRDKISLSEKSQQQDSSDGNPSSNIIGQVVGDVKDPENPRFTLNELKDVLTERNTLKSKLIEIEEELSYYKAKASEAEGSGNASWQEEELASGPTDLEASYTGDVQGPINKEPWEKLNPNAKPIESGIRKFFKFLGFENKSQQHRSDRRTNTRIGSKTRAS
ncbi:RILPL1 [Bugula neritina]|uniref:RILPL1 n=1 Tax=Bugula neritina TaxID=10212 RepID=A0A7J7JU17_BUGNE|nr:RILPL1 [Bugula neritina]